MNKSELRQHLRTRRKAIPPATTQLAARKLAQRLEDCKLFFKGAKVAAYLANDGEIDPKLAIARARDYGADIYLPCITPNQQLCFRHFAPRGELQANTYNIPEPTGHSIALDTLNTILLPLVGFDATGRRLGMGGGYYDRTLAALQENAARPKLVGLAYSEQQVSKLPADSWDIPLDMIVTPDELITC